MNLVISEEVLDSAKMTPEQLSADIAVMLYADGRLTLAQAARLAGKTRMQFQDLLAEKDVPLNYDVADLEEDVRTLQELRKR